MNFLLNQTEDHVQSFTSYWALFESVDVIKKANVQARMVLDGVPTKFYSEFKSDEYRLEDYHITKITRLIDRLIKKSKKTTTPLQLLRETADIETGIPLILRKNLEGPDSFHVGIAVKYGCEYFIAKDRHYFREKIVDSLEDKIKMMRPQDFIKILQKEGIAIS